MRLSLYKKLQNSILQRERWSEGERNGDTTMGGGVGRGEEEEEKKKTKSVKKAACTEG